MFTINYSDPDKHGRILNGDGGQVQTFEDALIIAGCVAKAVLFHLNGSPAMVSVRYGNTLLGAYYVNWHDAPGEGFQWKTAERVTGVND